MTVTNCTRHASTNWEMSYNSANPISGDEVEEISAIQYDNSGEFLAVGNRGGKVTIYHREKSYSSSERHLQDLQAQFSVWAEFQSHEQEFDCLQSIEIGEQINQIVFTRPSNGAQYILSTNDKTIKLWKIRDQQAYGVSNFDLSNPEKKNDPVSTPLKQSSVSRKKYDIQFPDDPVPGLSQQNKPKKVYGNAHRYHINSISLSSDEQIFLSADDLRINLWNMDISEQTFTILDIKPPNMDDLREVITSADFHPMDCNILMYASSRGSIKVADLRQSALLNAQYYKVYECPEVPHGRDFFAEITASISDVKFSPEGNKIIARDFLSLNIWDVRMNNHPVQTFNVHDHMRSSLRDLYESDRIFDKFECAVSRDGKRFVTGSYNNQFHIFNEDPLSDITLSPISPATLRRQAFSTPIYYGMAEPLSQQGYFDINGKVLQTCWHPLTNEIVVGIRNNFYVYSL